MSFVWKYCHLIIYLYRTHKTKVHQKKPDMQTKAKKHLIAGELVKELHGKLRRGDYDLIAEMLRGKYQRDTVSAMLRGRRTMKPVVFEAALKLIETIDNLKNEVK